MEILKLPTLDLASRASRQTKRAKRPILSAALPSTWPLKLFRVLGTTKKLTGGVLARCFTKCFVAVLLTTSKKIGIRCWRTLLRSKYQWKNTLVPKRSRFWPSCSKGILRNVLEAVTTMPAISWLIHSSAISTGRTSELRKLRLPINQL